VEVKCFSHRAEAYIGLSGRQVLPCDKSNIYVNVEKHVRWFVDLRQVSSGMDQNHGTQPLNGVVSRHGSQGNLMFGSLLPLDR
jgi:hypothetical protein